MIIPWRAYQPGIEQIIMLLIPYNRCHRVTAIDKGCDGRPLVFQAIRQFPKTDPGNVHAYRLIQSEKLMNLDIDS